MEFMNSPFVVPVAGCLVGIVAIISGIWLDAQKRRLKSEERVAMISRGVPISEIERLLGVGERGPRSKIRCGAWAMLEEPGLFSYRWDWDLRSFLSR